MYYARPQQLVLCLNERTLLAVLVQACDVKSLAPRFREAALGLLARIGVLQDAIAAERRTMTDVAIGPTANRRVVGCLNQAALALAMDFELTSDKYLIEHEIFLSWPASFSKLAHRWPAKV